MFDLAECRARYSAMRPRILSGFNVTDVTPVEWIDNESSIRFDFELTCTCGSQSLSISGAADPEWDLLFAPVRIRCRDCSQQLMEFDETRDGYDGELGHLPARDVNSAEPRREYDARKSQPLVAAVYYMADVLDDADLAPRARDLFGWFQIWRSEPASQGQRMLVDCECA